MLSFSLRDAIPSGKNQIQLAWRRGRLHRHPNARFERWRRQAGTELLAQVRPCDKPLRGPLKLVCTYRPQDRYKRDVPGMVDALFHLLEYCGIVEDDNQIQTLRWTQMTRLSLATAGLRRAQPSRDPCLRVILYARPQRI